ncbi:hypothetical protein YB2330_000393 [Saitoella coloradoensis]
MHSLSTLVTVALLGCSSLVSAIPTISTKGKKFYDSNGDQFYLKGIAYQRTPDDPLLDANQCKLDFELMASIGTNVIRVYHVDPTQSHTDCMSILEENNIYLLLDLDTFTTQINQSDPTWTGAQYAGWQSVMDEFAQYDNLLGYFSGNEVITTADGSPSAPFIKASIRDAKAYLKEKSYREVPVGYAAADIAQLRPMLQDYLACDDVASSNSSLDFFGLNIYEWCQASDTFTTSGYSARTSEFADYPIPAFFSEFGCNVVQPRTFADIPVLYGDEMTDVWSGGLVYEWIEETNDYGLISYPTPATPYGTYGSPTPLSDFYALSSQWASISPSSTPISAYTPTITSIACPASTSGAWDVDPSASLPDTPASSDVQAAKDRLSLTWAVADGRTTAVIPPLSTSTSTTSSSASGSAKASGSGAAASGSSASATADASTAASGAVGGQRSWSVVAVGGSVVIGLLSVVIMV